MLRPYHRSDGERATRMMAAMQMPSTWALGQTAIILVLIVVGGVLLFSWVLRRSLRQTGPKRTDELSTLKPAGENPTAFMAASMQAVIQKLREQEKELEALHRREKERALHTERLSEAVTRNMPAGLLLVNNTGLIASANPAAETALGVKGLAYRRYTEALGTDSALARLINGCLESGATYRRQEIEYLTPTGEVRQLGVTISPISAGPGSGKVSGALCLLSDLTELTLLQKQIQLKENLAALGELSAGIAHEFKNALATISGYAQMIRGETSPEEVAEHAERILQQTRALTHVVTEFLKFARPLDVEAEEVTLRPLVERAVAEVQESQPGVTVSVEGEFAEVSGDEPLLQQAVLNLARNAAEAAAGQAHPGRVTVTGSMEQSAGHAVQRISVTDNGPGISAQDLPRIFLPFYTTKASGTGLGLAVVQKIVVQHGGAVEARNRPEGGAEFIVWLPLRRAATRTVDSAAAAV